MLHKIRTFSRQAPAVRRRTPAALAVLPAVSALLRLAGFARCRRWLAATSRVAGRRRPDDALAVAQATAEAVRLAARNVPCRALCLERSLTVWWLLRRSAVDAELRIGVRRAGGALEAHAWVEVSGRAVGDAADVGDRFAPFEGDVAAIAASIRGPAPAGAHGGRSLRYNR